MSGRILFIDDNAADCDLFGLAMEEVGEGQRLATECNAAKAVERLKATADDDLPSLILLDLNMPQLNGKEVLRWIRAQSRLSGVRVVMFSTSSRPADEQECRRLGADDYVVKPGSYDQLVRLARRFTDLVSHPPATN